MLIFWSEKLLYFLSQDESVDGTPVLTILCNHTFHIHCLAKWGDTRWAVNALPLPCLIHYRHPMNSSLQQEIIHILLDYAKIWIFVRKLKSVSNRNSFFWVEFILLILSKWENDILQNHLLSEKPYIIYINNYESDFLLYTCLIKYLTM